MFEASALNDNSLNKLNLAHQLLVKRGRIVAGDGKTVLARSLPAKGGTWTRFYPTRSAFAQAVGYSLPRTGQTAGLELSRGEELRGLQTGLSSVVSNGYVSLPGNNVTFPAIGVTASGRGVMGFTVVGRDHFPGSGYAAIDAEGVGRVRIAAEGEGPQDGFPGYKAFFGRPQHWGDYAAAAVSGSDVWIANEYIGQTCDLATFANPAAFGTCGGTRVALANWATEISHLRV